MRRCARRRGARVSLLSSTRPPIPVTRIVSFLLAAPILGVLVWIGVAEFNALAGWHRLLSPSDLGSPLVNNSFAPWLLGMLGVRVLVIAQFALAQPEASATSGRVPSETWGEQNEGFRPRKRSQLSHKSSDSAVK